jgi:hypothetical protein
LFEFGAEGSNALFGHLEGMRLSFLFRRFAPLGLLASAFLLSDLIASESGGVLVYGLRKHYLAFIFPKGLCFTCTF